MSEEVVGERLKANADVLDRSPLAQVREKELEIRGRTMEAQKKAEKLVADARQESARRLEEVAHEVEKEASSMHEAGLKEITLEVEQLAKAQDRDTDAMMRNSRKRVSAAVDKVLRMIVP
jgi:vacuolar-type H+-ATPase subunit H